MSLLGIGQIVVSVLLIGSVLLQERESGVSGVFGGDGGDFYRRRRGAERIIFTATVVLLVLFAGLALLNLVL